MTAPQRLQRPSAMQLLPLLASIACLGLLGCLSTNQSSDASDSAGSGGSSAGGTSIGSGGEVTMTGGSESGGMQVEPSPGGLQMGSGGVLITTGGIGFGSGGTAMAGGVMATGGSETGGTPLGGTECFADEIYSRSCEADADCEPALHHQCCGGEWRGVNTQDLAAYEENEARCESQVSQCDCAEGPAWTQDGLTVTGLDQVGVRCDAGECKSYSLPPGGPSCGEVQCDVGQYCLIGVPGVQGADLSYSCDALPAVCNDCGCLVPQNNLPFCECTEEPDGLSMRCYYP